MANNVDVTNANFEQEVLNAEQPVLLKFWAPGAARVKSWHLLLMKWPLSVAIT